MNYCCEIQLKIYSKLLIWKLCQDRVEYCLGEVLDVSFQIFVHFLVSWALFHKGQKYLFEEFSHRSKWCSLVEKIEFLSIEHMILWNINFFFFFVSLIFLLLLLIVFNNCSGTLNLLIIRRVHIFIHFFQYIFWNSRISNDSSSSCLSLCEIERWGMISDLLDLKQLLISRAGSHIKGIISGHWYVSLIIFPSWNVGTELNHFL